MLFNYSKRACKLAGRQTVIYSKHCRGVLYITCSVFSVRNVKKYHSTATRTPGRAARFPTVIPRRTPARPFPSSCGASSTHGGRQPQHPTRPMGRLGGRGGVPSGLPVGQGPQPRAARRRGGSEAGAGR